jgi:hypothetical protein
VELPAGTYNYEWFNPAEGKDAGSGNVQTTGDGQQFKTSFEGEAVLYLKRQ